MWGWNQLNINIRCSSWEEKAVSRGVINHQLQLLRSKAKKRKQEKLWVSFVGFMSRVTPELNIVNNRASVFISLGSVSSAAPSDPQLPHTQQRCLLPGWTGTLSVQIQHRTLVQLILSIYSWLLSNHEINGQSGSISQLSSADLSAGNIHFLPFSFKCSPRALPC